MLGILSIQNNSKYLQSENINKIETYANDYIKSAVESYLYKTSKDFGSDIAGFGKYLVGNFLTLDSWINYNWLDQYKNTFFTVNINTSVKSSYE